MIRNSIITSYPYYKETCEEKPVTLNVYKDIAAMYSQFLIEMMIEKHTVSLPHRMGKLLVEGKKITPEFDEDGNIKNLSIDFHRTNKLWAEDPEAKKNKVKVYHTNNHSGKIRYKIKWSKRNMVGSYKWLFAFKLAKHPRKRFVSLFKAGVEF
jgi:ferric iron reductase protein FhuF